MAVIAVLITFGSLGHAAVTFARSGSVWCRLSSGLSKLRSFRVLLQSPPVREVGLIEAVGPPVPESISPFVFGALCASGHRLSSPFTWAFFITPERTRTSDLRFRKPPLPSDNVSNPNDLASRQIACAALGAAVESENPSNDPALAKVVEAWTDLPEAIKAAILAMIETCTDPTGKPARKCKDTPENNSEPI